MIMGSYINIVEGNVASITSSNPIIQENGVSFLLEDGHENFPLGAFSVKFEGEDIVGYNIQEDYVEQEQENNIEEVLEEEVTLSAVATKIEIVEQENADLLLDSVMKDIRIEQNELDIADLLLVIGGM